MASSARLTKKQLFWQQHVQQAQLHKGSMADYAKQHQLKASALYYWADMFKRKAASPSLAPAKPVGFSAVRLSSPTHVVPYSLQLPSITLHCSVLPDPQWLVALSCQLDSAT